jgi:two-component system, NarL family, nitrate/nitrite response regulator NarL
MADDLRVLIVAEDPLVRAGLAGLVAAQPGCLVVGRAESSDELASAIETYRPDVLLWDLGWNPRPVQERLSGVAPVAAPLVVLLPDAAHAAAAWAAGARGLLRRDVEGARLVTGLVAVTQGLGVVDPEFIPALASPAGADEAVGHGAFALLEELTPRELEVLHLMAEGLPNKTIALRLGISEHTVKFHVNAILGKLGVASRTEAVVRATRLGLILL